MKTFKEIVEDSGLEARSYSGRCMYGANCLGVVVDSGIGEVVAEIIEHLAGLDDDERGQASREAADAFRGVRKDSIGHGTVVYFPSVPWEDEEQDEEQEDEPAKLEDWGSHPE